MPLPAPAKREKLHHRSLQFQGYARADGLWDIEGTITDTKTYAFANRDRGGIAAGEALHDMHLRVTLDSAMRIVDIAASMEATPYRICPGATVAMKKIIGVQIKSGWTREIRTRLGKTESCTHLVELLRPLATVAFQTIRRPQKETPPRNPPDSIDQCYAFARTREVVKVEYPQFYEGE